VREEVARDAFSQVRRGGAHGFDFAVRGVQLFEGAAAEEVALIPDGPECDLRLP
jgi:hypothetical protein